MSLLARHLDLTGFRSYASLSLELSEHLTVLVGPNAAGKTNVIEALQILLEGESFRRPVWADTVKKGEGEARLSLTVEGEGRKLLHEVTIDVAGSRKAQRINGKRRIGSDEAARAITSVLFTPDDLRMVKDAAERRRSALDSLGGRLSEAYVRMRREYERTLRQRNAALRSGAGDASMAAIDDVLVVAGARLMAARKRLFSLVAPEVASIYETIGPHERLSLEYVTAMQREGLSCEGKTDEEALREGLRRTRGVERLRATTICGPHRDDIAFSIDGQPAREFASQGQQRSVALAWKMAEASVICQITGARPLLLLDDVMSELDEARREALTEFIKGASQAVVTTTNLGYFSDGFLADAHVLRIG